MMRRIGSLLCLGATLAACGKKEPGVPPEAVADYVFQVISSDRAVYAEQVVHRLQNVEGVMKATEHFQTDKTLPLPAQMLRMGAQRAAEQSPLRYALISPWAINKANLPKSEVERRGMEQLAANPDVPYRGYETVSGRRYFRAVYPDRAVTAACVRCHNEHPDSPRRDFKEGDVMGAITISLPLE